MSEWRFRLSIILAMFAVPMYALGIVSLGNQMGGVTGFIMKLTAIVGAMGGFFIHSVLCLFPLIYFTGMIDVPVICAFLNPFVFLVIGVLLRKVNYNLFYDLPGICMPSLGLGMFGLIGILNLI